MFHAVFLITLGVLLLLNNFGFLPWNIWQNLVPFWPVFIIFAGIDTVFGKSRLGRFLSALINSIIFLSIVARVIGINFKPLEIIPLPSKNMPIELFFADEDGVNQRFYNFHGRKGTF